jgi:hypothetical protein
VRTYLDEAEAERLLAAHRAAQAETRRAAEDAAQQQLSLFQ